MDVKTYIFSYNCIDSYFFCVWFPHAMGRVAPAGAGVTFRRRKVTKRRHGTAPPGTPDGPGQRTRKSRSSREGFVPTARSRIKRGFLPFGLCCSFPFLCYFCGCDPVGDWRGHAGEHSSPARCAVSGANLLFPQK